MPSCRHDQKKRMSATEREKRQSIIDAGRGMKTLAH
jgi:hypothetical protein